MNHLRLWLCRECGSYNGIDDTTCQSIVCADLREDEQKRLYANDEWQREQTYLQECTKRAIERNMASVKYAAAHGIKPPPPEQHYSWRDFFNDGVPDSDDS